MIWQFDIIILVFMVVAAIISLRVKDLLGATMVFGIYSFLICLLWAEMGAVDVAFTEAAVGAGVSTVLMLGTLSLTVHQERHGPTRVLPFVVVFLTGAALFVGTLDMPAYGDPNAPIHQHVAPDCIAGAEAEFGLPNIVTAVLASYRGYDTLGETAVIFTAAVGVMLMLVSGGREPESGGEE